jgi:hypothetical protein
VERTGERESESELDGNNSCEPWIKRMPDMRARTHKHIPVPLTRGKWLREQGRPVGNTKRGKLHFFGPRCYELSDSYETVRVGFHICIFKRKERKRESVTKSHTQERQTFSLSLSLFCLRFHLRRCFIATGFVFRYEIDKVSPLTRPLSLVFCYKAESQANVFL